MLEVDPIVHVPYTICVRVLMERGQALIELGHKLTANSQSLIGAAVRCRRRSVLSESHEVYKVILRPHESEERKVKVFLEAIEAAVCQDSKRLDTFMEILELELQPVDGSLLTRVREDLEDAIKRARFGQCTHIPHSNAASQAAYVCSTANQYRVSSQASGSQSKNDKVRKRVKLDATCSTEVQPVEVTDKSPQLQQQQQHHERFACALFKLFTRYDVEQEKVKCKTLNTKVEMLEQKLKQQSSDYGQICADKKVVEIELENRRTEVNNLIKKRDEKVASLQNEVDEFRHRISENEKCQNELKTKCMEYEHQLAEIVDHYNVKISQCKAGMQEQEKKLAQLESVIVDQKEKIVELQQEIQKLLHKNLELIEEVDGLRSQVFDFKSKNCFALCMYTFVVIVLSFSLAVIFTVIYHN